MTDQRERTADIAAWAANDLIRLGKHIVCGGSVNGALDRLVHARELLDRLELRLKEGSDE